MTRRVARHLGLGVVIALGSRLLAPDLGAAVPAAGSAPLIGELAPGFTLRTLDGKVLTRDGLKGKAVLLDFWATWCIPCIRALPELKDLRQKNAGQPLVMISVSVDWDRKAVEDFVSKNRMDWPQAWDGQMQVTHGLFRVTSFPSYVLLDHQGRITYQQAGWAPGHTAAELAAAVSKVLAATPKASPARNVAAGR